MSRAYRRQGVWIQLFHEARDIGRAHGAKFLYISATPTENTVNFYRGLGAVVAPTPNPELYALEPDEYHLVCLV